MVSFLHPWLLAGLAALALPILIHLLNRFRYRTVPWAPMEFLLGSHRRNRRRIWLEQFLLLLSRLAIIALLVFVVARPQLSSAWGRLFAGNARSTHVVILDDSFSMGQRDGEGTAFDKAKVLVSRLFEELERAPGSKIVSLLMTSRPTEPEISATELTRGVMSQLKGAYEGRVPSALAASPADSLVQALEICSSAENGARVAHVISDFQAKDWAQRKEMSDVLRRLTSAGARVELIDVTSQPPENLAVVGMEPRVLTATAGMPMTIDVLVRNTSAVPFTRVDVTPSVGERVLPSRSIEQIGPVTEVSVPVEVQLPSPGSHEVSVRIAADGLAIDNSRSLGLDVPESVPVLIVDGSTGQRDSLFLALALAPGENVGTALVPEIQSPFAWQELDLSRYPSIYFLNVPEIDAKGAEKLRAFVEQGGGLAFFLGDQVNIERYNTLLHGEKATLLPAMLVSRVSNIEASPDGKGDLRPEKHPLFEFFTEERNSFLDLIAIAEHVALDEKSLDAKTRVVARHRDGAVLWMEKGLGAGRVMWCLTTAGDGWTSWPQNPTYVVTMLKLHEYLSTTSKGLASALVGGVWKLRYPLSSYRPEAQLTRPTSTGTPESVSASVEGSEAAFKLGPFDSPGVYRLTRTRVDGEKETTSRAFHLDPKESELAKITPARLAEELIGIPHVYRRAEEESDDGGRIRWEPKDGLLLLLAFVLLMEQWLGRRLSFARERQTPKQSLADLMGRSSRGGPSA